MCHERSRFHQGDRVAPRALNARDKKLKTRVTTKRRRTLCASLRSCDSRAAAARSMPDRSRPAAGILRDIPAPAPGVETMKVLHLLLVVAAVGCAPGLAGAADDP